MVANLKGEVQFSQTILEDLTINYIPIYPNVINF